MEQKDLRSYLQLLKEQGELVEVEEEIDPRFEITALLKEVLGEQSGPAVLFKNIRGYPGKNLTGNLLASRKKMALTLDGRVDELRDTYLQKRFASLEPETWKGPAPAQEEILQETDLFSFLPAPMFHEGDAGHYLTAGVLMARDPDSGHINTGIHRLQLKGRNKLGVFLSSPPLSNYFVKAEERGEPLQVAVALGLHPAELLAAAVTLKEGMKSKIHLAGGLAGRPLPLVKAKSIDLMVPALAEIILEGKVLPGIREPEGPFGESTGYYFQNESPVIEVEAITSRKDPILSVIPPWGIETDIILSTFSGAEIWQELQNHTKGVLDVAFLPGSLTFQGIIQVDSTLSREEIRRIIHLSLNVDKRLKHVIVVDEDVDIHNLREVMWALGTRFQGHRDIVSLYELEGYVIDPSVEDGKTTKLGLDATARPEGPWEERYRRISLPGEAVAKARKILEYEQ